jgi:S1-C subfamily serine protease
MLPARWFRASLVVLGLFLSLASAAQAGIHEQVAGACCWTLASTGPGKLDLGSGWIVNQEKGLIVVSEHAVTGHTELGLYLTHWQNGQLVHDSSQYVHGLARQKAKVLASDPRRDLALIQTDIPAGYPQLKLAAASPKVGDKLYFVGNSSAVGKRIDEAQLWKFGELTVTMVGYRVAPRNGGGAQTEARLIEARGNARQGDSGGPVVNEQGEVVGVVSATNGKDNSLAVLTDISELRRFLDRFQNGPPKTDPAQPLVGRWHIRVHIPEKPVQYAAVDLLARGKVLFDGSSASGEGSYRLAKGQFTLVLPDVLIREVGSHTWDGDNRFTVTTPQAVFEYLRDS